MEPWILGFIAGLVTRALIDLVRWAMRRVLRHDRLPDLHPRRTGARMKRWWHSHEGWATRQSLAYALLVLGVALIIGLLEPLTHG